MTDCYAISNKFYKNNHIYSLFNQLSTLILLLEKWKIACVLQRCDSAHSSLGFIGILDRESGVRQHHTPRAP